MNASGIANSSFQDFTRVFERNRPQLLVSGVAGNQGILGDEITLSGIADKFSYSFGQYHYQTDGYHRPYGQLKDINNTAQHHDIYNIFLQSAINSRLNTQFEFINRDSGQGSIRQALINNPDDRFSEYDKLRENTYRAGINLRLFTDDHFLASYIHKDSFRQHVPRFTSKNPDSALTETNTHNDFFEGQYLHKSDLYNITAGFIAYSIEENQPKVNGSFDSMPGPDDGRNGNREYIYTNINFPTKLTTTFGVSYDFSEIQNSDNQSRLYPKAGLLWDINNKIKFRLAYFSGSKMPIETIQTLEPSQIVGFNQFYDDITSKQFSFYGGAVDFVTNKNLFSGFELSRREVKNIVGGADFFMNDYFKTYINWVVSEQSSISAQYKYIRKNKSQSQRILFTHIIPLEFRYFDSSGFFWKIAGTYVNQAQDHFVNSTSSFFLLDASIGFRLP